MEELDLENRKLRDDLARLRDLIARGTEDGQARTQRLYSRQSCAIIC